jgi:hypothetical protein
MWSTRPILVFVAVRAAYAQRCGRA